MKELTDLEICKRIAEIEGVELIGSGFIKDNITSAYGYYKGTHKTIEDFFDWADRDNLFKAYKFKPMDDEFNHRLMIKYKVTLHHESPGYHAVCDTITELGVKRYISACDSSKSDNPNKAICLAIIEANQQLTIKER